MPSYNMTFSSHLPKVSAQDEKNVKKKKVKKKKSKKLIAIFNQFPKETKFIQALCWPVSFLPNCRCAEFKTVQ